uniref:RING-type domain-containing protein n=1 Tax=Plectus sambesii TaxID=2011161 RepID=A0A914X0H7_9BILA
MASFLDETISYCTVCLDAFDEGKRTPRMLFCGHTVCGACIDDLAVGRKTIACPICRAETLLPADFPKNFELTDTLSKLSFERRKMAVDKKQCSECETLISFAKLRHCLTCSAADANADVLNQLCADCCLDHHMTHEVLKFSDALQKRCSTAVESGQVYVASLRHEALNLTAKSDSIRSLLRALNQITKTQKRKLSELVNTMKGSGSEDDISTVANLDALLQFSTSGLMLYTKASNSFAHIHTVLEKCETELVSVLQSVRKELNQTDEDSDGTENGSLFGGSNTESAVLDSTAFDAEDDELQHDDPRDNDEEYGRIR